jgi:hypothetical protein
LVPKMNVKRRSVLCTAQLQHAYVVRRTERESYREDPERVSAYAHTPCVDRTRTLERKRPSQAPEAPRERTDGQAQTAQHEAKQLSANQALPPKPSQQSTHKSRRKNKLPVSSPDSVREREREACAATESMPTRACKGRRKGDQQGTRTESKPANLQSRRRNGRATWPRRSQPSAAEQHRHRLANKPGRTPSESHRADSPLEQPDLQERALKGTWSAHACPGQLPIRAGARPEKSHARLPPCEA